MSTNAPTRFRVSPRRRVRAGQELRPESRWARFRKSGRESSLGSPLSTEGRGIFCSGPNLLGLPGQPITRRAIFLGKPLLVSLVLVARQDILGFEVMLERLVVAATLPTDHDDFQSL